MDIRTSLNGIIIRVASQSGQVDHLNLVFRTALVATTGTFATRVFTRVIILLILDPKAKCLLHNIKKKLNSLVFVIVKVIVRLINVLDTTMHILRNVARVSIPFSIFLVCCGIPQLIQGIDLLFNTEID